MSDEGALTLLRGGHLQLQKHVCKEHFVPAPHQKGASFFRGGGGGVDGGWWH